MKTTKLYRHFDAKGALLYVGISICPIARLNQHRYSHWSHRIAKVTIECFPDREQAVKAEDLAIRTEKPRYNKVPFFTPPLKSSRKVRLVVSVSKGFKTIARELCSAEGRSISNMAEVLILREHRRLFPKEQLAS